MMHKTDSPAPATKPAMHRTPCAWMKVMMFAVPIGLTAMTFCLGWILVGAHNSAIAAADAGGLTIWVSPCKVGANLKEWTK